MNIKGTYTAIVTPFTKEGEIDFTCLRRLVDLQILAGVQGIVPCGTTGESPTLTKEEQHKVIQTVIDQAHHRCQVIAGAGSYNTQEAIELTKKAKELGCDAVLSVNPYYNKPTQEGLYRHFKAIHDAVDIPIILYNIKGRTGVNIETSTLLRLAELPRIVGVKEASGDIQQIQDVIDKTPHDFSVLSGDDNMTYELIKRGGQGVISVISNLIPKKMVKLVSFGLEKDFANSKQIHDEILPLMEAEFIETNPIPIKAMMAFEGLCEESYRLPLCEMQPQNREKVRKAMAMALLNERKNLTGRKVFSRSYLQQKQLNFLKRKMTLSHNYS